MGGRAATSQGFTGSAELPKVGWALLIEGVSSLLRLVRHVEEQRGVTSELLLSGEPVAGSIDRRLHPSGSPTATSREISRPRQCFCLEVCEGYDLVHHAHCVGIGCPNTGGTSTRSRARLSPTMRASSPAP